MIRRILACVCAMLVFGCAAFQQTPGVCTEATGTIVRAQTITDPPTSETVAFTSRHCANVGPSRN